MSSTSHNYVNWFRQSSPYINKHRGKTFVLTLPGEALAHPNFGHIIYDIALLKSLGVRLVVVHGARPQIDQRLEAEGLHSQFHRNLRITEAAHLPLVIQAIGQARIQMEAALSTGVPNSPMDGARMQVVSGNFVVAMPAGIIEGVDLEHTGGVRRINNTALISVLDQNALVLLSPMGYSSTGEVFNLSFTEVASQAAKAVSADKLISFIEPQGLFRPDGQLLRQIALQECRVFMQTHAESLDPQLFQALEACYQTCLAGVPRAQLVSYVTDGALLTELFTRDGQGTLLHSDNYEQLRTASIDDVGGILALIGPLENQGVLVRRSRELLETEIDRFQVLVKDGTIIGCAALYPFDEAAELACMVIHPDYRRGGRASSLLQHMEQVAQQKGVKTLFSLTTQAAHWFIEQGFKEAKVDQLPVTRRQFYNYQRNSKVLIKSMI
mgnify:CR=1 FL=1